MVMAQTQPCADASVKCAEVVAQPLTDRFQRFEAGSSFHCMDPDTLSRAVVNGSKDGDLPLCHGHHCCGIRSPELVRLITDDGALMRIPVDNGRLASRTQQLGRSQQAQNPAFGRTYASQT